MRCAPLAALAVGLIAAAYVSIAHADDARTEVGIANTGEIHARDIIVKYGLTEPEVRALFLALQKEEGAQVNKVTELATRLAVTSEAVRNFFRILQEQQVKEEDLLPKLAEIAGSHLDLLARPKILEPDEDPAVAAAITEARSAVDRGDYEAADRLLSQAENLELAAANVALELERQAQAAKERHLTRAAAKRGERGELSLGRLDYLEAAKHFGAAANLLAELASSKERTFYQGRQAEAFYRHGNEFGDNSALTRSAELWRMMLGEMNRARSPGPWAITQNTSAWPSRRWANAKAGRRGWKRRSRPIAPRSRSRRATLCRWIGP